jgi:hypothetical protein
VVPCFQWSGRVIHEWMGVKSAFERRDGVDRCICSVVRSWGAGKDMEKTREGGKNS